MAKVFMEYMQGYSELYVSLAGVVKKYVDGVKKPVVVDVGCGPGLLLKAIYDFIDDVSLIGVDISEEMLRVARGHVNKAKFLKAKSDDIALDDNSVDLVVSRFSLTYWDKPSNSFNEIYRILKPGGWVVLEVLNRDYPKWKLFLIKTRMVVRKTDGDLIRYHVDAYKTAYNFEQVSTFLIDANFQLVESDFRSSDWKFLVVGKKK